MFSARKDRETPFSFFIEARDIDHGFFINKKGLFQSIQKTFESSLHSHRVISLKYDDFPSQISHAIEENTMNLFNKSEPLLLPHFFLDGHLS